MALMEFNMRLYKTTKYKVCYRENTDRIGRIYLSLAFAEKINLGEEVILQLALDKDTFSLGGYAANCIRDKETKKKIRFTEDIGEKGELGVIYVNKDVLQKLGVEDKVAVRIAPENEREGGILVEI